MPSNSDRRTLRSACRRCAARPASQRPRMSPAKASSISVRSCARNWSERLRVSELAGAHVLHLHAALEAPRADAHEGDAIAVLRIHVRLDLEDEGGELGRGRARRSRPTAARASGGGARSMKRSRNGSTPKLFMALPKNTGRDLAGAEALEVEGVAGDVEQLELGQELPVRLLADRLDEASDRRAHRWRSRPCAPP